VYALAFSGGPGALLAAVTGDNRNTVFVFDWAVRRLVATGPGYAGVPPQVFGAAWDMRAGGGQLRCDPQIRLSATGRCSVSAHLPPPGNGAF